jgi:WD40 repeat protein
VVSAVAAGRLLDGTPVIVSGGYDGTVRVWRLADGRPVGQPITGHDGAVTAVAVSRLPDGTPIIVSGEDSGDGTVRVWRLADGIPVASPLDLPGSVSGVAVHGNLIITAAGADIAVHEPAHLRPMP